VTAGSGDDFVAAQKALAEDWGFRSFNDALRSWIATVAIVEVGYVGEWEEYTHELMARDYLNELARRSPDYGAEVVEREVAIWDERFRAATVVEAAPPTLEQAKNGLSAADLRRSVPA
jgi:hypothetical protein